MDILGIEYYIHQGPHDQILRAVPRSSGQRLYPDLERSPNGWSVPNSWQHGDQSTCQAPDGLFLTPEDALLYWAHHPKAQRQTGILSQLAAEESLQAGLFQCRRFGPMWCSSYQPPTGLDYLGPIWQLSGCYWVRPPYHNRHTIHDSQTGLTAPAEWTWCPTFEAALEQQTANLLTLIKGHVIRVQSNILMAAALQSSEARTARILKDRFDTGSGRVDRKLSEVLLNDIEYLRKWRALGASL